MQEKKTEIGQQTILISQNRTICLKLNTGRPSRDRASPSRGCPSRACPSEAHTDPGVSRAAREADVKNEHRNERKGTHLELLIRDLKADLAGDGLVLAVLESRLSKFRRPVRVKSPVQWGESIWG